MPRRKMAVTLTSISAFSSGLQRISTVLLWLSVLARVDAHQNSSTIGEVQTLLRFKEMTEVDGWVISKGYWRTWKESDENTCAWAGVTCTKDSTVEQLSFSGWELKRLSSLSVLSNLTDLRMLDFSYNNFRDIGIPDDIGSLIGLTHLDLSHNWFSGPIPRGISACQSLRYISLEANALAGEIPDLSGLVNLKYLLLSHNQLSGSFPKSLGKLDSPLKIDLTDNMFTGSIPSLSNLTNLLELLLDNNTFTGFEEGMFPDAKNLEHLSVSGNQLQGSIPANITKLVKLRTLDLSRNQLSGHIPYDFCLNMSDAVWFDLSQNQLTGSIPERLLQPTPMMANLPGLKLSHNFLTGHVPFDGTKHYNYYVIDLSHNHLSGPIPSICNNGTSFIHSLSLQNNNLSGDIVDFLGQCYGQMTEMRLADNSFSGDLSKLEKISNDADNLRAWNLNIVDISNNNLRLSTTEVNGDPLRAVLEFFVLDTSVTEFRMQGNYLSGTPLPSYFPASATFLEVLDLSNNHLQGQISGAAFNSTWLPALQSLNLSNNDIMGPVPDALVMLPNLAILVLTNNRLSGRLPAGLPDRLYNPSFFYGNDGICGGPLHSCPQWIAVEWWVLLLIVGGSVTIAVGSVLVALWRWRVYRKRQQQDGDLIKMLLERESAALMSLRDLKKATDNFADSAQIGEGGFGTVYTGKLSDGTMVAIKRSKRDGSGRREGSETEKDQFLNEVRILSQVNHRHLVKLLGCCMENKVALLVFEFVSNGTLQEYLHGKRTVPLSWKQRLRIAIQTADALNYLHSAATFPIYHRDVKSANILLNDELNAKVADFGISKLSSVEATHVSTLAIHGTLGYIDPEYYLSYQLTDKSDVYSFGVVLLELISAKPAIDFGRGGDETSLVNFARKHIENENLQQLIDGALTEPYDDMAGQGRESILNVGRLAMKCLHMRSKARPSMSEVLKELQNLWVLLEGTSEELNSPHKLSTISGGAAGEDRITIVKENDGEDPRYDNNVCLSDDFCSNSSSSLLPSDATGIQMSQLSQLARQRSRSNRW